MIEQWVMDLYYYWNWRGGFFVVLEVKHVPGTHFTVLFRHLYSNLNMLERAHHVLISMPIERKQVKPLIIFLQPIKFLVLFLHLRNIYRDRRITHPNRGNLQCPL